MKKRLYSMMLLLTLMLFAQSAQAQFSASISEELKDDYATTNISFSLAEVATTLNTTADVLIEELDKWKSSGYPMTDIFTLDGQTNLSHSADDGGFYMDKSGQMSWWSSEGYWYCQLYWDAEADEIIIGIGQNPTKPLTVGRRRCMQLFACHQLQWSKSHVRYHTYHPCKRGHRQDTCHHDCRLDDCG